MSPASAHQLSWKITHVPRQICCNEISRKIYVTRKIQRSPVDLNVLKSGFLDSQPPRHIYPTLSLKNTTKNNLTDKEFNEHIYDGWKYRLKSYSSFIACNTKPQAYCAIVIFCHTVHFNLSWRLHSTRRSVYGQDCCPLSLWM